MMSCSIDTKEGRCVVVRDITRAFLQADMQDTVHMVLEGKIAKHIVKLEQTIYRKYIRHNQKVKPMLYVQLKQALYSTLPAVLLFWKLLLDMLIGWGFAINPYNQCIVNNTINGRQCTMIWHVDDFKNITCGRSLRKKVLWRQQEANYWNTQA